MKNKSCVRWLSLRGVFAAACLAAVVGLAGLPAVAHAEETRDISQGNVVLNEERGGCPGHVITGSTTRYQLEVESGEHTVTLNNAHMDEEYYAFGGEAARSGIAVRPGATLNLKLVGENSASSYRGMSEGTAGINVEVGATLVINGPGRLVASGTGGLSGGAAGIGGHYNYDFGTIIINSGDIEAHGGAGGAGIGAGYDVEGGAGYDTAYGTVTVNGGRVAAYGGEFGLVTGAGIGAGENGDYEGTVTVNGGVVYALGGDEDTASIGGGGSAIGQTGNGTFTTGENGNGIILAPYGIGDVSHAPEWDGIFVGASASFDDIDETFDPETGEVTAVTFKSNTADVYGDPVVDYSIAIDAPATMRVTTSSETTQPATLTMAEGTTLTNNNKASDAGAAGINLQPGSKLVLPGGIEQCKGDGTMVANTDPAGALPNGVVQLPITEGLVTLPYESVVYDGTAKEPAPEVKFDKWTFEQTFATPAEYTVSYKDNVNVGTATVTLTAVPGDGSNLLASTYDDTFQITQADFKVDVPATWTVQTGEDALLSKLPKASFPAGTPDAVTGGTLSWFSDKNCTVPLADDSVKDKAEGEQVPVYWKYTQDGDVTNYPATKTGSTTLIMSKYRVPNAAIFVDGKQTTALGKVYGDGEVQLTAMLDLDRSGSYAPVDPEKSTVAWSSSDKSVVTVDGNGKLTFTGAGEADVIADISEYDAHPNDDESYAAVKAMIHVTVAPKPIEVDLESVEFEGRPYDGTRDVTAKANLKDGSIVPGDEDLVSLDVRGRLVNPVAGTGKRVFALFNLAGAEDKVDDYTLTPRYVEGKVDITKATPGPDTLEPKAGEMTVYNGLDRLYTFDLTDLNPGTKDLGNGDFMQIGDVDYTVKSVTLSDGRYFSQDDIVVDNQANTLTVRVHDVDSTEQGELGTIEVTLTTSNFEDMTATITVNRENPEAIYTVTASAGEGGTIDPAGTVEYLAGDKPVYTIVPDEGYEIADVTVDGESVGAVDSYAFEGLAADHEITATFKAIGGAGGSTGDDGNGNGQTPGNGSPSGDELPATADASPVTAMATLAVAGAALVCLGVRRAARHE